MTCGVYRIRHKPSGAAYVGGSQDVQARWWWHEYKLDEGEHSCRALQKLWDRDGEKAFVFELLQVTSKSRLRKIEDAWASLERKLLSRKNNGYRLPVSQKIKMSIAAKRVGADPEERRRRSERAKAQHAAGKLGATTWTDGPRYNPRSAVAGAAALRRHIAAQSSAEMSRRSRMRRPRGVL